jgi:hypothetical protein
MPRINAARIARGRADQPALPSRPIPTLGCDLVVATVGPRSPLLIGPDWIRVDGGHSLIDVSRLVERHAPLPALFDIPGASSPRYRNLLTTTEALVFAATTGFGWVNLRDLEDPDELDRAREFLGEHTRLSCTVAEPRILQRHLDEICELGDALLLDIRALSDRLPPSYLDALLHAVLKRARERATPTLLVAGFDPRPGTGPRLPSARLGSVGRLLAAGAHGLVLTRETELNPRAQDVIDLARELIGHVRSTATPRSRARAGRIAPDDSSGWMHS